MVLPRDVVAIAAHPHLMATCTGSADTQRSGGHRGFRLSLGTLCVAVVTIDIDAGPVADDTMQHAGTGCLVMSLLYL